MTADHNHAGKIYVVAKEIVEPGKPPSLALWLNWCDTCNRITLERPKTHSKGRYQTVILYEGDGQKELPMEVGPPGRGVGL